MKLMKHVLAYPSTGSPFAFEENLKFKLMDIYTNYAEGKPALVVYTILMLVLLHAESCDICC